MSDKMLQNQPVDPEICYRIGELLWQTDAWREALTTLIREIRPYFIFDNMVVYLIDPMTLNLDVAYAKATGRGKSAEADVAWGEILANRVIESRQTVMQNPDEIDQENRLRRPYTLGVPLQTPKEIFGAMIFIRFGGPQFTSGHVSFADYLSRELSLQMLREKIKRERDHLEFQYRIFQVQEDFISTVSHELRTPLGFIKGYTTTLLRTDAHWDTNTQQEFLSIIDQETDRLQDLLANLLDSAKLQSGQIMMNFQTVRLDALMNDLATRTKLHNPDVQVNIHVKHPTKNIQADPKRLIQIFENLIGNAIKYAPESPIHITIDETDTGVCIEVRDEGPGIPEKYANHIFDRFFRIPDHRPDVHGSGLGLFICKQIVQAHSGEIRVSSIVGQGTTFNIQLPDRP
jgi:signal transduction histidine kinase